MKFSERYLQWKTNRQALFLYKKVALQMAVVDFGLHEVIHFLIQEKSIDVDRLLSGSPGLEFLGDSTIYEAIPESSQEFEKYLLPSAPGHLRRGAALFLSGYAAELRNCSSRFAELCKSEDFVVAAFALRAIAKSKVSWPRLAPTVCRLCAHPSLFVAEAALSAACNVGLEQSRMLELGEETLLRVLNDDGQLIQNHDSKEQLFLAERGAILISYSKCPPVLSRSRLMGIINSWSRISRGYLDPEFAICLLNSNEFDVEMACWLCERIGSGVFDATNAVSLCYRLRQSGYDQSNLWHAAFVCFERWQDTAFVGFIRYCGVDCVREFLPLLFRHLEMDKEFRAWDVLEEMIILCRENRSDNVSRLKSIRDSGVSAAEEVAQILISLDGLKSMDHCFGS